MIQMLAGLNMQLRLREGTPSGWQETDAVILQRSSTLLVRPTSEPFSGERAVEVITAAGDGAVPAVE